ncbi:MAG: glycosyltransferase family 2 protein [Vicinamibacterales bacterium]
MVPDTTVVVCTRDRPAQLETCLDSLAAQTHLPFEVLVVDNGASGVVTDICRARGVACIREPIPGLTRARNLGARAARGEIVAYIDDDATAEPGWLNALVREFADPGVAAVAGRTRYMTAWDGLRMTQDEAPGEPGPRLRQAFDRSTRGWFAQACFGRIGDGNTMAFRRSVLLDAVRFDERLGRGRLIESGDEHVAFMSLISDGHRVVHAPEAAVRHPMPGDPRLRRAKRLRDLRASFAYMIFLWFQFPTHRGDLSRFVVGGLYRRAGGTARAVPAPTRLSAFQALAAAWSGICVYLRARREWLPGDGRPAAAAMPRVVTLR